MTKETHQHRHRSWFYDYYPGEFSTTYHSFPAVDSIVVEGQTNTTIPYHV